MPWTRLRASAHKNRRGKFHGSDIGLSDQVVLARPVARIDSDADARGRRNRMVVDHIRSGQTNLTHYHRTIMPEGVRHDPDRPWVQAAR